MHKRSHCQTLDLSALVFFKGNFARMPHKEHLDIIELHPTFGAEVRGVDFSRPEALKDAFPDIHAAITKVIESLMDTFTAATNP